MPRAVGERDVVQGQPRAQGDEAIGQAELNVLTAIGDLVEGSPGSAGAVGQGLSV